MAYVVARLPVIDATDGKQVESHSGDREQNTNLALVKQLPGQARIKDSMRTRAPSIRGGDRLIN